MSEVLTDGHLSHGDHELAEFKISSDRRKTVTRTSTLDMGRTGFRLLRELVSKVSQYHSSLRAKVVQTKGYGKKKKSCLKK